MSKGYSLSGNLNPLQSLIRAVLVVFAAIGSFFMLAASAAFALFFVAGLLILAGIVFAVLWIRAKISGKPMIRRAQMFQFQGFDGNPMGENGRSNAGSHTGRQSGQQSENDADGPVIDAHQTPDGWSVDT